MYIRFDANFPYSFYVGTINIINKKEKEER